VVCGVVKICDTNGEKLRKTASGKTFTLVGLVCRGDFGSQKGFWFLYFLPESTIYIRTNTAVYNFLPVLHLGCSC